MRVERGYQGPGGTGIARRCWAALRMDSLSPSHAARILDSTVSNPLGNRVVVMHQGELAGELQRSELSEEAIMHLATGGASRT